MSGTTFSVATHAQQLYPGWQKIVTLVNNGPASVWISEDASVNIVTSFRLRPNGVVTWQANKALYAICDDMSSFTDHTATQRVTGARLAVMDGALDTSNNDAAVREIARINTASVAYANTNPVPFKIIFESASYESIRIDALINIAANVPFSLFVTYYTDEKLLLASETYVSHVGGAFMIPPASLFTIPTAAAYTSIRLVPNSFPGNYTLTYVKITGFMDRQPIELSMRDVTTGARISGPGSVVSGGSSTSRSLTITGWTGDQYYLPAIGQKLRLYVVNGHTSAVTLYLFDALGAEIYRGTFAVGSASGVTLEVPATASLFIAAFLSTLTNVSINFTWTD